MSDRLTPQEAEAIVQLATDLTNHIDKAGLPDSVPWHNVAIVLGLVARAIAARQMHGDPDLTLDHARAVLLRQFASVLDMPEQLVQVVDDDVGEGVAAAMLPIRRH